MKKTFSLDTIRAFREELVGVDMSSVCLSDEQRLNLFFQMLRIRKIEETVADRYAEQKIRCPMHLSIGQEGTAVGVCAALRPEDIIMSTHRAHAHYLAKGGDLCRMISEFYGKKRGCCGGVGGSMHLIDLSVNMLGSTPIVGGTFPVAVGIALANKMKKSRSIVVSFFGEGMTEEGVFFESINFAALHHLPILFVCENNQFSVYSPLSVRQPVSRDLVRIAEAHGIPASRGDGNNVEEVFQMTTKANDLIQSRPGPFLLEFSTYRWREHCGPNYDNHIGYRREEEFLEWKSRCPVVSYQAKMESLGALTQIRLDEFSFRIQSEIEAAFAFAEQDTFSDIPYDLQPLYAP